MLSAAEPSLLPELATGVPLALFGLDCGAALWVDAGAVIEVGFGSTVLGVGIRAGLTAMVAVAMLESCFFSAAFSAFAFANFEA